MQRLIRSTITHSILACLALLCLAPAITGAYFWWKQAKLYANRFERLSNKPIQTLEFDNTHPLYSSTADEFTINEKRFDVIRRERSSGTVRIIGYFDEEETGWWSDVYQGWKKLSKEKTTLFFLSWYLSPASKFRVPEIPLAVNEIHRITNSPQGLNPCPVIPHGPPRLTI